MTAPLPNCFSICPSAVSSALLLSSAIRLLPPLLFHFIQDWYFIIISYPLGKINAIPRENKTFVLLLQSFLPIKTQRAVNLTACCAFSCFILERCRSLSWKSQPDPGIWRYPEIPPAGTVLIRTLPGRSLSLPVSYTHLDVYKRQYLYSHAPAGLEFPAPLREDHPIEVQPVVSPIQCHKRLTLYFPL